MFLTGMHKFFKGISISQRKTLTVDELQEEFDKLIAKEKDVIIP